MPTASDFFASLLSTLQKVREEVASDAGSLKTEITADIADLWKQLEDGLENDLPAKPGSAAAPTVTAAPAPAFGAESVSGLTGADAVSGGYGTDSVSSHVTTVEEHS